MNATYVLLDEYNRELCDYSGKYEVAKAFFNYYLLREFGKELESYKNYKIVNVSNQA